MLKTGFYNFDTKDYNFTIEPGLSDLESKTCVAFEKITKERSVSNLNDYDRSTIGYFISVQIYRTRYFREKLSELSKRMSERMKEYTIGLDKINIPKPLNEKEIKDVSIKLIIKGAKELMPHLLSKKWLLYETSELNPFYISDNPVVRQNHKIMVHYGEI